MGFRIAKAEKQDIGNCVAVEWLYMKVVLMLISSRMSSMDMFAATLRFSLNRNLVLPGHRWLLESVTDFLIDATDV